MAANKPNKWVREEYPISCVNSAIAAFLKDGRDITGVIGMIQNSGVKGQHLKLIFQMWKGFGKLDYWEILFDECQKENLF